MNWFLFDNRLRHERVKTLVQLEKKAYIKKVILEKLHLSSSNYAEQD